MNDSLVGRNVDTAILLGSREAEYVVVLIDSSAHSAE